MTQCYFAKTKGCISTLPTNSLKIKTPDKTHLSCCPSCIFEVDFAGQHQLVCGKCRVFRELPVVKHWPVGTEVDVAFTEKGESKGTARGTIAKRLSNGTYSVVFQESKNAKSWHIAGQTVPNISANEISPAKERRRLLYRNLLIDRFIRESLRCQTS